MTPAPAHKEEPWKERHIGKLLDYLAERLPATDGPQVFSARSYGYRDEALDFYVRIMDHRWHAILTALPDVSKNAPDKDAWYLVLANISVEESLRGQGFMTDLLKALPERFPSLGAIKFENVLNPDLTAYLKKNGYQPDMGGESGCSWYKQTPPDCAPARKLKP